MVDTAIVVIEAGSTPYDMIERALQVIGKQRVLGFVLNGVEDETPKQRRPSWI
jgi:Mrp family chromosome partitioning ATPase